MGNTIATKYVGGPGANTFKFYSAVVTIDTYATGGVTVPINGFIPEIVVGCECADGSNTYEPAFDLANKKIKLYTDDTTSGVPAEVSAGSITSTVFHLTLIGRIA